MTVTLPTGLVFCAAVLPDVHECRCIIAVVVVFDVMLASGQAAVHIGKTTAGRAL